MQLKRAIAQHGLKQSTESPILDASFWSENGVSCPQCGHERNKIGDSVLWTKTLEKCNNISDEPKINVKKFPLTAAVGNSPLILDESPFRRI